MVRRLNENNNVEHYFNVFVDLWDESNHVPSKFVFDCINEDFDMEEIVYFLNKYRKYSLEDAYELVDSCFRKYYGESGSKPSYAYNPARESFKRSNIRSSKRANEAKGYKKSDLTIDMWYGDKFNTDEYEVDCTFYPNDGEYRGNIYRLSDGKVVGDYSCSDSTVIEDRLGYDFD